MNLSSQRVPQQLQALHRQRQALLKVLLGREPLMIGTVYDVLRRCGNPTCHCATKPSHRQTLFIYVDKGKRRCRFVRQKDAERVRMIWRRYKNCKKALNDILTLNKQEVELLRVQIRLRGVTVTVGGNSKKA